MKVAVTGAAGHVGGNLVRALLERRHQVRAIVYQDTRAVDGLAVERVPADVLDADQVQRAFEGVDWVFHLAAKVSIEGDPDGSVHRTNVLGTRHVVEACLARGVKRLVHFSSVHALRNDPYDVPMDEGRPLADEGHAFAYDLSKAGSEREVQAGIKRGLDAVIVNPTAILGPSDFKPSRMGQVLVDLHFRRLPALVAGGFDFVDVRDVAEGAIAAAERGRTGERYLLGNEYRPVRELAGLCRDVAGIRPPRFTSPLWLARAGAPFAVAWAKVSGTRPLFTEESLHALAGNPNVSHEKATRELGYRPRPLATSVADTYGWLREAGLLETKT
ncbi:MAG: NAD-dependent epimerase/dehydratase family protein [bacterium]